MAAIGHVTHNPERDTYQGTVRTLTIAANIMIVPNGEKTNEGQPDYRIYTSERTEIGAAWTRIGKNSGQEYLSLTLAAPELGKRLFANLGRAANSDNPNEFAIIWNPES